MTLIVGVLCSDGVVMGADGAASFGALGQMTVVQPVKKLCFIEPHCMILGVSGPVGLAQRFEPLIANVFKEYGLGTKLPTYGLMPLRKKLWEECLEYEFSVARKAEILIGHAARISAISQALLAMPTSKGPCLIQFDQQGAPELASPGLPFVAIGGGQGGADPFISFLRRMFWKDRQPNLAEGIFVTYWILDHGIKTSTGGVTEPKQIAILEVKDNKPAYRELTSKDLQETQVAIANAEDHIRGLDLAKNLKAVPTIPKPPEPPLEANAG